MARVTIRGSRINSNVRFKEQGATFVEFTTTETYRDGTEPLEKIPQTGRTNCTGGHPIARGAEAYKTGSNFFTCVTCYKRLPSLEKLKEKFSSSSYRNVTFS